MAESDTRYIWTIHVQGKFMGQIYLFKGQWRWLKLDGTTEPFDAGLTMTEVQQRLGKVMKVPMNTVAMMNTRKKWPGITR